MSRSRMCLVLVLAASLPVAYSQETPASVRFDASNRRISVSAQNVPLRQLLDEIKRAADISVSAFPGAETETISATFSDLPLEQGLRFLLGGYDSIFLYSAGDTGRSDLKKIWVYPKGQAAGLEPASQEALAGTSGLRDRLNDPNPAIRARAFQALLNRPGTEEQDIIARSVSAERDESVRAAMVESVRNSGLQLRPDFWGSLSADPSEHVRLLVLDALEGTPEVRDLASLALSDPSPHVQLRAKEILESLGVALPGQPCNGACGHP